MRSEKNFLKIRRESEDMNKTTFLRLAAIFFVLAGCLSQPSEPLTHELREIPEIPGRGFFMGMLPTPQEGQSFEDAYGEAVGYCEVIPVWGRPSPFYELGDDLSGTWGKTFVDTYIKGNGMIPLIHVSFIDAGVTLKTPPEMKDATLSDPEWRQAYKMAILTIVRSSRPFYLSLGNEVNRWYEKYGADDDLNGFAYYVTLYEEIYDAVKEISPDTRIFCTFSREIVSENREADLDVLHLFNPEKIDVLMFTSYPFAVQGIQECSDIPDDYYSRCLNYMPGKPLGFTEIAWSSADFFGGERGQADFLYHITGRLTRDQGVNLQLLCWPWLCDLSENDQTGLKTRDGTEKMAFNVWEELFSEGERFLVLRRKE